MVQGSKAVRTGKTHGVISILSLVPLGSFECLSGGHYLVWQKLSMPENEQQSHRGVGIPGDVEAPSGQLASFWRGDMYSAALWTRICSFCQKVKISAVYYMPTCLVERRLSAIYQYNSGGLYT